MYWKRADKEPVDLMWKMLAYRNGRALLRCGRERLGLKVLAARRMKEYFESMYEVLGDWYL